MFAVNGFRKPDIGSGTGLEGIRAPFGAPLNRKIPETGSIIAEPRPESARCVSKRRRNSRSLYRILGDGRAAYSGR